MAAKLTQEQVIARFHEAHGARYDYSLVEYVGVDAKVKIICRIHGTFKQTPKHHSNGMGCRKCVNQHQYSTGEFIVKVLETRGRCLDNTKPINTRGIAC